MLHNANHTKHTLLLGLPARQCQNAGQYGRYLRQRVDHEVSKLVVCFPRLTALPGTLPTTFVQQIMDTVESTTYGTNSHAVFQARNRDLEFKLLVARLLQRIDELENQVERLKDLQNIKVCKNYVLSMYVLTDPDPDHLAARNCSER